MKNCDPPLLEEKRLYFGIARIPVELPGFYCPRLSAVSVPNIDNSWTCFQSIIIVIIIVFIAATVKLHLQLQYSERKTDS